MSEFVEHLKSCYDKLIMADVKYRPAASFDGWYRVEFPNKNAFSRFPPPEILIYMENIVQYQSWILTVCLEK